MKYRKKIPVLDGDVTLEKTRTKTREAKHGKSLLQREADKRKQDKDKSTVVEEHTPEVVQKKQAKKWPFVVAGTILIVGISVVLLTTLLTDDRSNSDSDVLSSVTNQVPEDVDIITPKQDDIEREDAAYESEQETVSYLSQIEENVIAVSQQPVPEEVIAGTKTLKDIALDVPERVTVIRVEADAKQAYLVQSLNDKQTLIALVEDKLIFVTSNARIDQQNWSDFLASLE